LLLKLRTRFQYLRASGRLRRVALYGGGGLVLAGLAWILITGALARQQAIRMEDRLHQVEGLVIVGKLDAAQQAAHDIPVMARRAHWLTTGPAWWAAAHVPFLGRPLEIVRGTTEATHQIGSNGIPTLLQVATSLDPTKLRTAGDTIDLAPLIAAEPTMAKAARTLDAAVAEIGGLPQQSWLKQVDGPRNRLEAELRGIQGYVDAAARVTKILPTMLGVDGPKRYFVGLQNEAELRGTGGLPGAFAVVIADHGTIKFTHFESDTALLPVPQGQRIPTGLDFGADYNSAYGAAVPTSFFTNSNMSPHFPYAAQVWARMWQKASGEHVDGAIALDPAVLGQFLAVTGPVAMPDGSALSSANVVTLTQRDEYAIFPTIAERKAYLVAILKAASTQLTSGKGSALGLMQAMSASAKQHRVLVWSADPAVESALAETNYAGVIPEGNRPFVGLVLNNVAAGKMDFYLARTLTYHRSGCGPTRDVIVTVTLTNHTPVAGLSPYVTTRLDRHANPVRPGDNRTLLDYYASSGAQLLSVTLNGEPATAGVEHARGHPIFRMNLELPRGTTQTVVLHLAEPAGTGTPQIWQQPGVTPLAVRAYSQPCG
jgi:hypothetical protein